MLIGLLFQADVLINNARQLFVLVNAILMIVGGGLDLVQLWDLEKVNIFVVVGQYVRPTCYYQICHLCA